MRSSSDSDEECASGAQVSEDKIIQLSQVRSESNRILRLRGVFFGGGGDGGGALDYENCAMIVPQAGHQYVLQDFKLSQIKLSGLLHPELLSCLTIALFGFVEPYTVWCRN